MVVFSAVPTHTPGGSGPRLFRLGRAAGQTDRDDPTPVVLERARTDAHGATGPRPPVGAVGLRRLDPETAHRLSLDALKAGLGPVDREIDDPALSLKVMGLPLTPSLPALAQQPWPSHDHARKASLSRP